MQEPRHATSSRRWPVATRMARSHATHAANGAMLFAKLVQWVILYVLPLPFAVRAMQMVFCVPGACRMDLTGTSHSSGAASLPGKWCWRCWALQKKTGHSPDSLLRWCSLLLRLNMMLMAMWTWRQSCSASTCVALVEHRPPSLSQNFHSGIDDRSGNSPFASDAPATLFSKKDPGRLKPVEPMLSSPAEWVGIFSSVFEVVIKCAAEDSENEFLADTPMVLQDDVPCLTFLKNVGNAWSQKSFCKQCWFVFFFASLQWWSTSFYTMRFTTLILKKWCVCIFGSCLGHYSVRYNACTEKVGSFAYKKGECWWESVSCRCPCGYPWLLPSLPPFLSKDQTAEQDSDPPAEPSTTVAPVTW